VPTGLVRRDPLLSFLVLPLLRLRVQREYRDGDEHDDEDDEHDEPAGQAAAVLLLLLRLAGVERGGVRAARLVITVIHPLARASYSLELRVGIALRDDVVEPAFLVDGLPEAVGEGVDLPVVEGRGVHDHLEVEAEGILGGVFEAVGAGNVGHHHGLQRGRRPILQLPPRRRCAPQRPPLALLGRAPKLPQQFVRQIAESLDDVTQHLVLPDVRRDLGRVVKVGHARVHPVEDGRVVERGVVEGRSHDVDDRPARAIVRGGGGCLGACDGDDGIVRGGGCGCDGCCLGARDGDDGGRGRGLGSYGGRDGCFVGGCLVGGGGSTISISGGGGCCCSCLRHSGSSRGSGSRGLRNSGGGGSGLRHSGGSRRGLGSIGSRGRRGLRHRGDGRRSRGGGGGGRVVGRRGVLLLRLRLLCLRNGLVEHGRYRIAQIGPERRRRVAHIRAHDLRDGDLGVLPLAALVPHAQVLALAAQRLVRDLERPIEVEVGGTGREVRRDVAVVVGEGGGPELLEECVVFPLVESPGPVRVGRLRGIEPRVAFRYVVCRDGLDDGCGEGLDDGYAAPGHDPEALGVDDGDRGAAPVGGESEYCYRYHSHIAPLYSIVGRF